MSCHECCKRYATETILSLSNSPFHQCLDDTVTRACVRLSGAEVILGGEITDPLPNSSFTESVPRGNPIAYSSLGERANIKGFACEYMTSGIVVILGDPGPYAFAGMTGGVVYQKLTPQLNFDIHALRLRLAKGAKVELLPINHDDLPTLQRLLNAYIVALEQTYQYEEAERIRSYCEEDYLLKMFIKVIPKR